MFHQFSHILLCKSQKEKQINLIYLFVLLTFTQQDMTELMKHQIYLFVLLTFTQQDMTELMKHQIYLNLMFH
jgi:hypothetical protein